MPTPAIWGLSIIEKLRLALPVLLAARAPILAGVAPLEAIAEAGRARIECEYARLALRAALSEANLLDWQHRLGVRQSDKTRGIDRAIRLARRAFGHRGGWVVSPSLAGAA